jgi:hypothetical protein
MESNTAALLDFDQALQAFRTSVTPLLEIGDAQMWDGSKFKTREAQIVWAALVLAGQCIALLLHRLACSAEAHATATQRTHGMRRNGSQGHGRRTVTVLTIGNVAVRFKVPYVVTRRSSKRARRKGQRGVARSANFYPFLAWLGIEEGLTPLVWTTVAKYGVLQASFEAARDTLHAWGIILSTKRIARLTYRFGQIGLNLRQRQLDQLKQGTLPEGQILAGQRVVLSVDGGRARLRHAKRGRRRANRRHGYRGDWKEPKVLTIYVVDQDGHKVSTQDIPLTNDGTFGGVDQFMQVLEMHLVRLGIRHAAQVLFLADGALWMWERIPALLRRLGCPEDRIIELLDFYHATGHLSAFAEIAFSNPKAAQAWFKKACAALKRGPATTLLQQMQTLCAQAKSKHRASLTKELEYFQTRLSRLQYAQVATLKLPIGSGAVESLLRQVVNLRIKGAGKFWLVEHAEIMLHARCQWAAGVWEHFCASILTANLCPT